MEALLLSRMQFTATTIFHFWFVPVVLAYQAWTYFTFKDKVTLDDLIYWQSMLVR